MIFAFTLVLNGEPQRLPSIEPRYGEVRLMTPATNSTLYLSDAPVNTAKESARVAIPANYNFPLKLSNLDQVFVNGSSGDSLSMVCEVKPIKPKPKKETKDASN